MKENYEKSLKTVSFLFILITVLNKLPTKKSNQEEYEKRAARLKEIEVVATGGILEGVECEGGACPVR
jgi:hypothetical protein